MRTQQTLFYEYVDSLLNTVLVVSLPIDSKSASTSFLGMTLRSRDTIVRLVEERLRRVGQGGESLVGGSWSGIDD